LPALPQAARSFRAYQRQRRRLNRLRLSVRAGVHPYQAATPSPGSLRRTQSGTAVGRMLSHRPQFFLLLWVFAIAPGKVARDENIS